MRVAIGADHAGFELKDIIKQTLDELRVAYKDFGSPDSDDSVDYPDYAARVGRVVAAGEFDRGILICGTGIGMALAANKIAGIRAAPVLDLESARLAREHNNANVLAIGARVTPPERALDLVRLFLKTEFEGGRHERRLQKVAALNRARSPPRQRDSTRAATHGLTRRPNAPAPRLSCNHHATVRTAFSRTLAETDPEVFPSIAARWRGRTAGSS